MSLKGEFCKMTRKESIEIAIKDCKHYIDKVETLSSYMGMDVPYKFSLNFRLMAANYGELDNDEERGMIEGLINDYADVIVKITSNTSLETFNEEISKCDFIWIDTTKYLAIFLAKWTIFPDENNENDEKFQKDLSEKISFYEPYRPFFKKLIEKLIEKDTKNASQYKRFLMDIDLSIGGHKFIF